MDALVTALKEVDTKYSKHSDCMAQVLIKVGFLYGLVSPLLSIST